MYDARECRMNYTTFWLKCPVDGAHARSDVQQAHADAGHAGEVGQGGINNEVAVDGAFRLRVLLGVLLLQLDRHTGNVGDIQVGQHTGGQAHNGGAQCHPVDGQAAAGVLHFLFSQRSIILGIVDHGFVPPNVFQEGSSWFHYRFCGSGCQGSKLQQTKAAPSLLQGERRVPVLSYFFSEPLCCSCSCSLRSFLIRFFSLSTWGQGQEKPSFSRHHLTSG